MRPSRIRMSSGAGVRSECTRVPPRTTSSGFMGTPVLVQVQRNARMRLASRITYARINSFETIDELLSMRWQRDLQRWIQAGVIDAATAERIRVFELSHEKSSGLRWPVLVFIGLGGVLLAAGVLLFVAAHWDHMSPTWRFVLVLSMVGVFHVAGTWMANRFTALSTMLHAVGTVCLGAGIFLAAQIFHLQEHWPGGVMLWALGAWIAWALLRDWAQASLIAILTPVWIGGEWIVATERWTDHDLILAQAMLLLSITYISVLRPGAESATHKALAWLGCLTLIPGVWAVLESAGSGWGPRGALPGHYRIIGWALVLVVPLGLAGWLRRGAAWMNAVAALWVIGLGMLAPSYWGDDSPERMTRELGTYALLALGSVGLILWGLKEARKERINLGVACFALTVCVYYFSNVMDKLGRSASLIGLSILFILGGWLLERTRRRLVARMEHAP